MTIQSTDRTALPDTADVVVIGGGIVGCSAAYHLARQGIPVVLCEKGRIAGEQSSRNWGWIRQQGRDHREVPLMIESMEIWRGLEDEIGEDVGFVQSGCLYLARNEKELAAHAAWLPTAEEFGLDTRLVADDQLRRLFPGNGGRWTGALFTPSDGRAEPAKATAAIARAAGRKGAAIATRCAARGVEIEAGRVASVVTERGIVKTSVVICAGGVWTSRFCGSLGVVVPQLQVKGTVARTGPAPNIMDGAAWSLSVALRRRQDGGYTIAHGSAVEHAIGPASFRFLGQFLPNLLADLKRVRLRIDRSFLDEMAAPRRWPLDRTSPFEQTRVLEPKPSKRILGETQRNLARLFPELADVPLVETWAGMIEISPDAVPILSDVPEPRGLFVATGFSGHGFGIGPAAGRAIADLATGRTARVDLKAFRFSRFSGGSSIRSGLGV